MINKTGQRLLIVTEQDGEVINFVNEGETVNVRTKKQTEQDKFFSQKVKLTTGRFIKVMEKEKEVINKLVKYPSTYFALSILKCYIQFNTNLIMKDWKKYRCIDLANEMGITRQMASIHLKRLQEFNLIAEVPTNRGMFWAINPKYYRKGDELPKIVYDTFQKKIIVKEKTEE